MFSSVTRVANTVKCLQPNHIHSHRCLLSCHLWLHFFQANVPLLGKWLYVILILSVGVVTAKLCRKLMTFSMSAFVGRIAGENVSFFESFCRDF